MPLLRAYIILNSKLASILLSLANDNCNQYESTPSLFLSRSPVAFHEPITQHVVSSCPAMRLQTPIPAACRAIDPELSVGPRSAYGCPGCAVVKRPLSQCVAQLQDLL